jgi:hypothetical protein
MSRMKLGFAVLLLTAIAGVVPQAHAQANLKVMIVGASGSWQALGVGTFKGGACPTGSNPGCAHYTNGSFNLNDTRPGVKVPGTAPVVDAATVWIVWDNTVSDPTCATACNVWAYAKVDSIVGNRCYFASPRCNVNVASFPAPSQKIATNIWGADQTPPGPVQALFTTGVAVNVAASEIRPEDAAFGQCRINSVLGGANDGLAGLGYGTSASGTCPAFGAALSVLEGHDLHSAYPGSTQTAHPMAFNISGHDPFTNATIPAFTTINVGAVPLVFITDAESATGLQNVKNVSLKQLQTVFSGASCKGTDLGGGTDPINVYQREPLSGTMNAAEYTAFRLPRDSGSNYDLINGASQETGIGGIDPVSNLTCGTAGSGGRYRSVGNGDETSFILNSQTNFGLDGIGYMFFSYGNVSGFAAAPTKYNYLTIDNVDPIFQLWGTTFDPGLRRTSGRAGCRSRTSAMAATGSGS